VLSENPFRRRPYVSASIDILKGLLLAVLFIVLVTAYYYR
jgi:hypothetical protein